jgi:hypothetical protein
VNVVNIVNIVNVIHVMRNLLQIGSDRRLAGSFRTRDLRNGPRKYFIFSGSSADKEG